ncbi:Fic family protein [Candidatus Saccharibacteria bacterium]|nr:Fic family protein [Candidatus Saccharibacteria bacterium]
MDMESYEKVNDNISPEKKREYWETAFGLQAVDGLKPSRYMEDLASEHIEGRKSYYEVADDVERHYSGAAPSDEKEADVVSKAIYAILSDEAFSFDLLTYKSYHRRLFEKLDNSVFHPGEFRTVNITKKEPILNGATVQYQDYGLLEESLNYDFDEEKSASYLAMTDDEKIKHLANFTSHIWQVHPFLEGNTRTTAVFLQKYLRSLGYEVDNELFEKNSLYFRNALVRANYSNIPEGVVATDEYLAKFFGNLIGGEENALDNKELCI